jgi:acetyl-CoA C-acetyltransferase
VLTDSRTGARLGNSQLIDSLVHDGLWDAFNDYHMGVTAENLAREYGISRANQDDWALRSQQKRAPLLIPDVFAMKSCR